MEIYMQICYISVIQNLSSCFLRSFIKENVCHYLPGDIGRRGYNEESD